MTYLTKPNTTISAAAASLIELIKSSPFAVLCGQNNSGKSFILKHLSHELEPKAYYIGPARYQNCTTLSNISALDPSRKKNQLFQTLRNEVTENTDNSAVNLQQSISELTNAQRETLFGIMKDLLGSNITLAPIIEENEMSQKYILVDGFNLSFTSSGFRLILVLLLELMDNQFDTILIDEPELGLSPDIQAALVDLLSDQNKRKEFFPHIKSIIISTHSPIFLDRHTITNNYHVYRVGQEITMKQASSIQDISSLQFQLLGNRFETLLLPSVIVFVEGKTDDKFIRAIIEKRFPNAKVSIVPGNGDGDIKRRVHDMDLVLNGIRTSPYHERVLILIDQRHSIDREKLTSMGIPNENIIQLSKNGIEYYYPPEIMSSIFGSTENLEIEDDMVKANGNEFKKNDLCDLVLAKMKGTEELDPEFEEVFMSTLSELTSYTLEVPRKTPLNEEEQVKSE